MEHSIWTATGRTGEGRRSEVAKETVAGAVARGGAALICLKRASKGRPRTPSECLCLCAGPSPVVMVHVMSNLRSFAPPCLSIWPIRYSRGGKEKKAAKRNTSESSRSRLQYAANHQCRLPRTSQTRRDVSDFDPRKNRQPAPGDATLPSYCVRRCTFLPLFFVVCAQMLASSSQTVIKNALRVRQHSREQGKNLMESGNF